MQDHRKVDGLFTQYESLGGDSYERKRQLVDEMIHDLAVHAAIEEEETDFFPRLQQTATSEQIVQLGRWLGDRQEGRADPPVPKAPDAPPSNIVAAVTDRVRDLLKEKT